MDVVNPLSDLSITTQPPKVSVIMPVRNVERYIKFALTSIVNQSFNLFEILVLDDASTDHTLKEVASFQDARIRLFSSEVPLGLSGQLNRGLSLARGEFIARMDGDDWAHPKRFKEQVLFLEENEPVGICGTFYLTINSENKRLDKVRSYNTNGALKFRSFFRNPFCHPSVMFRKSLIDKIGNYQGSNSEDYELWLRAFTQTKFYVIPKILLYYRVHSQSFSVIEYLNQGSSALELQAAHLKRLIGNTSIASLFDMPNNVGTSLNTSSLGLVHAYDEFMARFTQLETLSNRDHFYINQELAATFFHAFLLKRNKTVLFRFMNYYCSLPFFDKITTAYIEHTYSFYFKDQILKAWIFWLLSFVKSPFNSVNWVLCGQLLKKTFLHFRGKGKR